MRRVFSTMPVLIFSLLVLRSAATPQRRPSIALADEKIVFQDGKTNEFTAMDRKI